MDNAPKYIFLGLVVIVVGAIVALQSHHSRSLPQEPPIQGAGSTFVDPLMVHWSSQYEKTESGCRIGYRSLGSSKGIKLIKTVKLKGRPVSLFSRKTGSTLLPRKMAKSSCTHWMPLIHTIPNRWDMPYWAKAT